MPNKIKGEVLVLDSGSVVEERHPFSNHVMKVKRETAVCSDFEMQDKIKTKESDLALDIGLRNEEGFPSSATVIKNNSDVYGMISKVEIKEEPWWSARTSTSTVSDLQMYSEHTDGANVDFPATESTRFHTETSPSTCSTATYLFSTADLEEKDSFKCVRENFEFTGVNIHEICGSDIVETSPVEQSIRYLKLKTPCDHNQSEKLNKCKNSSNKLHVCEICEKKFSQLKQLKAHILTHKGIRPFKCELCEKNFTLKGNLNTHMLIHVGKRPFRCDVCKKTFTLKGNLNKHIPIHQGNRPFGCDICKRSFTRKESLKQHTLIHQDKRPFKCDVCESSFKEKGHLKKHTLIHQGNKPFRCDVCERSFIRKDSLKQHTLTHKDKSPFKCDVCENSFMDKRLFKQHILIHPCKKPYKCDICENTFTLKGNLKKHILSHQGKRPYKCDLKMPLL